MTMDWKTYDQEFDSFLRCFADGSLRSRGSDRTYAAFSPVVGDRFEGDANDGVQRLLVIGRGVNGWESGEGATKDGWTRESMKEPLQRREVIKRLREESSRDWLYFAKCMAKVSAFWRTARDLLFEMNMKASKNLDESWPQYLGWTNLYKVSPAAGGNPSDRECELQIESCKRLLRLERAAWSHAPVLLVAGYEWWIGFESVWNLNGTNKGEGFIQFESHVDRQVLIVAKHPERKKQPEYGDAIRNAYRRLAGS